MEYLDDLRCKLYASVNIRRLQVIKYFSQDKLVMFATSQILMGLFRFGFIAAYLSDQVVGGFTTGAAVHVFTSQIGKVFGIKLNRHHGAGALFLVGLL